jgi:hypothetical protein
MRAHFMRLNALISIGLLAPLAHSECLSIEQTGDKTGARACVSAKVLKVVAGRGAHFLDFCEDYSKCPFTVVVFDRDLRDVGDVRELEGKVIEIHGNIVQYEGRSEIVLRDSAQLKGASPKLPPVPKTYDAERRGNFSATAKNTRTASTKKPKKPKRGPRDSVDPGTVD